MVPFSVVPLFSGQWAGLGGSKQGEVKGGGGASRCSKGGEVIRVGEGGVASKCSKELRYVLRDKSFQGSGMDRFLIKNDIVIRIGPY